MGFGELFSKTSPRPPIYLRNDMAGFKKNTSLKQLFLMEVSVQLCVLQ